MPIFWWLGHRAYVKFIGRELTSLFIAYAALLLLVQTWALGRGEEVYRQFLTRLESPAVVTLHVIVLVAVLFHTFTWLNLAPSALVVRLAGRRIPAAAVLLGHYVAWLGASSLVAWILLAR